MSQSKVYCLVMAGGKGTRLWPESTDKKPKQYLKLTGYKTLLTETLDRFDNLVNVENRFIITTNDQKLLAEKSSRYKINENGIILEPSGRNTAPCILLSLAYLENMGLKNDDVVAVMPSDHVILDKNGFQKSFAEAVELCRSSQTITTIGIKPHFPHTGYGYIKKGEDFGNGAFVEEFKEKPDFDTATAYLKTGNYLWNAGMFMGTLKVFKQEFSKHSSKIYSFYDKLKVSLNDQKSLTNIYAQVPKDSFDYAIMERSDKVTTVPASFDWNDLGSWEALGTVIEQKKNNTFIRNRGEFVAESSGNVVFAPNKFVSLINVNDMVIVSNNKALLVMPKKDSQRVKEVVAHLEETGNINIL